jgi:hypothetical protein
MPIIPTLGRLGQEDCDFEASLSYTVRLCLKKSKQNKQKLCTTHNTLDQPVLESTAKELRTVRPGGQNGRDGQGRE